MFAAFLDDTMSYSAAIFPVGPGTDPSSLEQAQSYKLDRLLACGVGPGTTVLDIGAGWGELALRAAAKGAQVRALTLSQKQHAHMTERVARAGLDGRVQVDLLDYRQADGRYDVIFSIEMVEAVGHTYLPVFLDTVDRLLAPGGRAVVQSTVMRDDRVRAIRNSQTWINKYVFPGAALPSVESIEEAVVRQRSLQIVDEERFRAHYVQTLRLWRERFENAADELDALGLDTVFQRTWRFYLASSEAGFRSGYLDVVKYVLARPS